MIFCRPRHDYQSYTDLWRLIELGDYKLIFIDEIDIDSDECYILISPDVDCFQQPKAKARVIYWLLEWYGDYIQKPGIAETWASNKTFATAINARYVPMGSHAGLGQRRTGDFYDIAHMSYDGIHRRNLLLNKLVDIGVRIAPNGWGDERHTVLMNTRAMLHIHQQVDYPAIAPLRASLAAAYALPFISENGWSTAPYNEAILAYPYDQLYTGVKSLLSTDLQYYGDELHNLLCDTLRFDKVVEAHV